MLVGGSTHLLRFGLFGVYRVVIDDNVSMETGNGGSRRSGVAVASIGVLIVLLAALVSPYLYLGEQLAELVTFYDVFRLGGVVYGQGAGVGVGDDADAGVLSPQPDGPHHRYNGRFGGARWNVYYQVIRLWPSLHDRHGKLLDTNATLILPDGIVNGQIPYDTQVTVKDDNATAWRIGEATVAYGTEYTFYVGSDVVVSPVYEAVEEKATTTIIGASLVGDSDFKYNIVATRNIPDGYEVIDYGFVYGKNLTNEDLDLDKVGQNGSNANSGAVKAVHAGTRNLNTNEFALNYGITAKNAPITAKSFVTVVKGDKTEIVYSDMFVQNY